MAEPTPPAPSDGDFLKILLVGMDKRADRIEGRLAGIEGTQSEILRLQIGTQRDFAAHLAAPLSAAHVDASKPKEPGADTEGNGGATEARVERALKAIVLKWVWENKKAAALALGLLGTGAAGGWTIQGCNGKSITISRPAEAAAPSPALERNRFAHPRSVPDASP